jgi:hypothetical protein
VVEPGGGVFCGDGFQGVGNGLVERFFAAGLDGAQKLLELRPLVFDGIQVR